MASKSLQVDIGLCVGCYACVVACKQEHNLPVGVNWMRIVKEGPIKVDGKLTMRFNPIYCRCMPSRSDIEAFRWNSPIR